MSVRACAAATEVPAHATRLDRPGRSKPLGNSSTVMQKCYKFVILWAGYTMGCVSVVVADRYPVFLCGLISVLREQDDFDIVASCVNGTECIQAIRNLSPRVALIDISMPDLSGLEILATAA